MSDPSPSPDTERSRRLQRLAAARLYFVCEGRPGGGDPGPLLGAAIEGGADIVQMREKGARSDEELVALAEPFRRAARDGGALFVLNDRPDLLAACGADGVHVGQEDMPVERAREIAGPAHLVGRSTHSLAQARAALDARGAALPDQISVGPVWATPTKEGRPATGLALIEGVAALRPALPWFAIGGIDIDNVAEVVAAGACRAVVVRAIRDAPDPGAAARALRGGLERAGPL